MKRKPLAVETCTALAVAIFAFGCDEQNETASVQKRVSSNLSTVFQGLEESMATTAELLPGLPVVADAEIPWEDIVEFLTDEVLIEENYDGNGYFRVWGKDLCEFTEDEAPDCAATVDLAEIRIRALELPDNGALLALAIGPDRVEPVVLETFTSSLTLTGDLSAARAAFEHLHNVIDDSIPLPAIMEGKVVFNIDLNGKNSAAMEVSIPQAIAILLVSDDADVFAFTTEARTPLWSFAAKPGAFSAAVDVGPTQLAAGPFGLDLRGMTGSVDMQEGDTQIVFENLSLGDGVSSASLDDHTLWSVELNGGQSLAVTLAGGEDAFPVISVDPEFDLSVMVNFPGTDVPDYLTNQTYQVRLAGESPAVQPGEEQLAVLSGELSISSTAVDEAVIVSAGQCLVEDEVLPGEHSIIGALASVPCP